MNKSQCSNKQVCTCQCFDQPSFRWYCRLAVKSGKQSAQIFQFCCASLKVQGELVFLLLNKTFKGNVSFSGRCQRKKDFNNSRRTARLRV